MAKCAYTPRLDVYVKLATYSPVTYSLGVTVSAEMIVETAPEVSVFTAPFRYVRNEAAVNVPDPMAMALVLEEPPSSIHVTLSDSGAPALTVSAGAV